MEKTKKVVLGQYNTSQEIADFMTSLSLKGPKGKALDPSFGEGVFIKSLLKYGFDNVTGYEIDRDLYESVKKLDGRTKLINIDFLKSESVEKFDLIIGNPPYVQWNNIDTSIRSVLTKHPFWSRYSNGEWDLLYAFMIWSVEKLKEGGELIFIVPYYWFNSTYASRLRDYMMNNGYFSLIIHFSEFKLFKDCAPNNIIFRYVKSKVKNDCTVFEYKKNVGDVPKILNEIKDSIGKVSRGYEMETENFRIFSMDQFSNDEMWYLASPSDKKRIASIEKSTLLGKNAKGYVKLEDVLDVGVGMVTGFDEAFIVHKDDLNNYNDYERKFILPFIKAKDCKRYFIHETSYYILVDEVQNESSLKSKMPNIYRKLSTYKERLAKRYGHDENKWWAWATVRNYDIFKRNLEKNKIFVPCLDRSMKARFSITRKGYYGSGDILVIVEKENNNIREDMLYILAWLNSNQIMDWYRIKGSKRGARTVYTQSYVSKIPIRLIDWKSEKEKKIYSEIISKTQQVIKNGGNEQYEKDLDNLFNELVN